MYIRLNVTTLDDDSRRPQGIIMASRTLADEGDVTNEEAEGINNFLTWFNEHLPAPPREVRHNLSRRAVFWFKQTADTERILLVAWELAWLLKSHEYDVQVWRANAPPGVVVWRDDYQIAVTPFAREKGREAWASRPLEKDNAP